jgi:hypothetical protein
LKASEQRCSRVAGGGFSHFKLTGQRAGLGRVHAGVLQVQEADPNPFAPPEETSTACSSILDANASRRLRLIFAFHISSVVLCYLIVRYEAFFFSGGGLSEVLFMAPIAAAFYGCPISVIATLRSSSQYSIPRKLGIIAVVLLLCVLQVAALLPLVQ